MSNKAVNLTIEIIFVTFYGNLQIQINRNKMVGLGGLEPPTSPLSGVRSNQLSYRPRIK